MSERALSFASLLRLGVPLGRRKYSNPNPSEASSIKFYHSSFLGGEEKDEGGDEVERVHGEAYEAIALGHEVAVEDAEGGDGGAIDNDEDEAHHDARRNIHVVRGIPIIARSR